MDAQPPLPAQGTLPTARCVRHCSNFRPTASRRRGLEASNRRALAQWEAAQRAAAGAVRSGPPWLAVRGGGGRASWAVGAAGLTVGIAWVLHAWLQPPDPALDELMQPDVLSQMAAGEM